MKALYALKQALNICYKTLVKFFKQPEFIWLELDYGIFMSSDKELFLAVYVDDLLICGLDVPSLEKIQQTLRDWFIMTDLGDNSCYLRMKVDQIVVDKITLCQCTYLKTLLDHFKMTGCKLNYIPIDPWVANCLLPYDGNTDKKTVKW